MTLQKSLPGGPMRLQTGIQRGGGREARRGPLDAGWHLVVATLQRGGGREARRGWRPIPVRVGRCLASTGRRARSPTRLPAKWGSPPKNELQRGGGREPR